MLTQINRANWKWLSDGTTRSRRKLRHPVHQESASMLLPLVPVTVKRFLTRLPERTYKIV
jgi:hypothetical protein